MNRCSKYVKIYQDDTRTYTLFFQLSEVLSELHELLLQPLCRDANGAESSRHRGLWDRGHAQQQMVSANAGSQVSHGMRHIECHIQTLTHLKAS